ncbi:MULTISPECIES: hypothetical protein [unclassified Motilimonas]|uniref:hypothetical protein n=1 Tax=unclassified Motilimonas TaxID=2643697 RepID=UPI001E3A0949|nr:MULTISPECIES: hypothetical protein [unclassified Motilimonas]MCE0558378.1 hypothetical protein [Motilimonas sp. E26]MDO6525270.1 hypothetical protein [Motilimonas sp. 1_MG-2023]
MSSNARSKKKSSSTINEVMEQAVNTSKRRSTSAKTVNKEQQQVSSSKFANIQSNTFYGIILDPSLTPTDKKNAVSQALTFANNKDDAKEKLEEFNQFKEFLQHERKRMAQEIIALTDTGAFSELKTVYDEINNALISFESKITPLTDIVDAVYTLRMNGVTFDVFREIAEDKEAEAELAVLREAQEQELASLTKTLQEKKNQIALLSEDKSWFGFGNITQASREKIALLQVEVENHNNELATLTQAMATTPEQPQKESKLVEYAEQKAKLRELLDISSTEHKDRQKALVTAAQDFIQTTEVRVGTVSEHFDMMNGQIDNLNEANFSMREMYAIINDATKEADSQNEALRDSLQPADAEEGDIERMTRERHKRDLENHIKALGSSAVDTTTVLAELTSSGHRIKSMQDANDQQISKTRQLHSSGVAGVADQLSTVLQAVSSAALGESSEMARMSLERMQQTTTALGQKEVIRVALGTQEQNSELSKALEDLEQYGQVIETATSITRDGLLETKDLLSRLENTAKDVQASVQESISVAADVTSGKYDDEQQAEQPQKQAETSPFGF